MPFIELVPFSKKKKSIWTKMSRMFVQANKLTIAEMQNCYSANTE